MQAPLFKQQFFLWKHLSDSRLSPMATSQKMRLVKTNPILMIKASRNRAHNARTKSTHVRINIRPASQLPAEWFPKFDVFESHFSSFGKHVSKFPHRTKHHLRLALEYEGMIPTPSRALRAREVIIYLCK